MNASRSPAQSRSGAADTARGGSADRAKRQSREALRRRLVRVTAVVLLTSIALMSVGGATGVWMWHGEPAHWQAIQSYFEEADEAELTRMAEDVENHTLRELSNASPRRSGGSAADGSETGTAPDTDAEADANADGDADADATRTLHLSYRRINAWLAYRLEPWLENQDASLPDAIARPMVTTTKRGELVLAFRLELPEPEIKQVMSIVFDVEVLEDGRARLEWKRTFAGRLPLPSQWVKQQVVGRVAEQAGVDREPRAMAALEQVLGGEPFHPLLDIDASRRARLVGLDVGEVGVDLTVRLEPRPRTSATPPARRGQRVR